MLKSTIMLNRARRKQLLISMSNFHALLTLKGAHLLRENRRFLVILRPQFSFQRVWNSDQYNNIDDYCK